MSDHEQLLIAHREMLRRYVVLGAQWLEARAAGGETRTLDREISQTFRAVRNLENKLRRRERKQAVRGEQ